VPQIGRINKLNVLRAFDYGFYLDGSELGEILLPRREAPPDCAVGSTIEAFVFPDNDDTLVATRHRPYAQAGEFAYLKVVAVNSYGVFVDWGLSKNLLVPFNEQYDEMEEGRSYLVYVYLDQRTHRMVGSTRIEKFLTQEAPHYRRHQQVDLLLCEHTDIGYKAIVDNRYWGVLHDTDVFQPIRRGARVTGYVKKVRPDGKLDLVLQKPGYDKVDDIAANILARIKSSGGFVGITDKSPPERIYATFGVSKKAFKMAISALYRERLIVIEPDGLRVVR